MARNFYPSGGDVMDDESSPSEASDMEGSEHEGKEGGDEKHEEMDGETAMLPKTILAGKEFNPGDEVVLKIVKMHGDEVEVAYAKDKGDEDEEPEAEAMARERKPRPEMDSMMGKIGAMGGGGGY